jgi:membrane protease YdiL (CAAX protease family)
MAAAASRLVGPPTVLRASEQAFGAAVAFLLLVSLFPSKGFALVLAANIKVLLRQAPLGIAVFYATPVAMSRPPPTFDSAAIVVLFGALAEEYVFRWLLPVHLMLILDTRFNRTVAVIGGLFLAQFLFAIAHFVVPAGATLAISDAARFFAGGLLYSSIIAVSGLGLAIGVHATMNFTLVYGSDLGSREITLFTAAICCLVGAASVWGTQFRTTSAYVTHLELIGGKHDS